MKKLISLIILVFSLLTLAGCGNQSEQVTVKIDQPVVPLTATTTKPSVTPTKVIKNSPVATIVATDTPKQIETITTIPKVFSLNINFAQQAPFGNWDAVHEETCEEAVMIMVDKYYSKQPLNETIMEEELQKLLKWEEEHGYQLDLSAQETVDVLKNYFGRTAHLSADVTVDQIKYEVSQGRPVIIPAAGKELGNPNFKWPGPIYHMLVVKGYNSTEFITNDPGTRKGNGWVYTYDKLIGSIHDWNPTLATGGMTDAEMAQGKSVIVVVDK